MSGFKLFTQTVIPRLDRGIQCIQNVLDPRVKFARLRRQRRPGSEDDKPLSYGQNLYRRDKGIR